MSTVLTSESFPAPASSASFTTRLGRSRVQPHIITSRKLRIKYVLIVPLSVPSRQESGAIGRRRSVLKESLGSRRSVGLLLNHSAVVGCLALHVSQHELAQLLHLLGLLIGHLSQHVEGQQPAVGALRLAFQTGDEGDLAVELLTLQPGGTHCAGYGVQRGLRPD